MSPEASPFSKEPSSRPPAHRTNVLVVDDEAVILRMISSMLSKNGFEVVTAGSGDEALAAAGRGGFDLVITDLAMPGKGGVEVLREIKAMDPEIEVIIMTGHSSIETAIACMKNGAYDYIQKPLHHQELCSLARQALEKRRLRGAVSLLEAGRELFRTLSLEELQPKILDLTSRVLRYDAAMLLCGMSGSQGRSVLLRGSVPHGFESLMRGYMEDALGSSAPVRIPGSGAGGGPAPSAGGLSSGVILPLNARGDALGAVALLRGPGCPAFTAGEVRRGEIFAIEASVALENARLYQQLEERMKELVATREQLVGSEKLAVAGRLASGIAHEINTPIQFVGDSIHFLRDAFADLQALLAAYRKLRDAAAAGRADAALLAEVGAAEEAADVEYLDEQVPKAIERTLDGTARVAGIVRAMKEFAHPDRKEKAAADLNRALQSTLTVARNELKYVAEVETEFGDLPAVVCHLGDLNQVFLNLLVNAAHAIGEVVAGTDRKGKITVRTRQEGDTVVVSISDTGCGIPEENRRRVFEPFFTTKEVGRGTGQGLAIARSIVVDKHGGRLSLESEVGRGTTFHVALPIGPLTAPGEGEA